MYLTLHNICIIIMNQIYGRGPYFRLDSFYFAVRYGVFSPEVS